jgi:hypothetical protein
MRGYLRTLKTRVERLGVAHRDACDREHVRCQNVFQWDAQLEPPPWPGPNDEASCVCGRPIEYRRVVHELSNFYPNGVGSSFASVPFQSQPSRLHA